MQASLDLRHYVPENFADAGSPALDRKAAESLQGFLPFPGDHLESGIGLAQRLDAPANSVGCFDIVTPSVPGRGFGLRGDGDRETIPRHLERQKQFTVNFLRSVFLNHRSPQIL